MILKKFLHYGLILLIITSVSCTLKDKAIKDTPNDGKTQVSKETTAADKDEIHQQDQNDTVSNDLSQNQNSNDNSQEGESPEKILENGLEAYQAAIGYWEQADIDNALDSLDKAYSYILKLDSVNSEKLIQEKNELRLLIAERIKEIYASHLLAVGENHKSIPLQENKAINQEIERFKTVEREHFVQAYHRSGRYRKMILAELKKEGLPPELSWIPIVESGFKLRAYSRARALGLWQFITSTAYRFGLKKDRWVDERMDPIKSTRAAVKYLKELHALFGDWTTALAAYNCGEFRVQRLIRAQKINYLDNFWDLYYMLPRETARFVPRIIAVIKIVRDPAAYGFDLKEPEAELKYELISTNTPINLDVLSRQLGLEGDTLANYNPELRYKATPDRNYQLKVPVDMSARALELSKTMKPWVPPQSRYRIHYVRRGETISGIARRYRTTIRAIARLNRLGRRYLIRPGRRLKIPATRYGAGYHSSTSRTLRSFSKARAYKVRPGDSLSSIAHKFNTTVESIKELNYLNSNNLNVGQSLTIGSSKPPGAEIYIVKKGDTLYSIAQEFKMTLRKLRQINNFGRSSRIYPGQQIWVID